MNIGFLSGLTLIFITMKLTEVINWSWWLVLLPIFISFGILILALSIKITLVSISKDKEK
ncbi:MAG: hypothetical protein FWE02_03690 [Defluviitaleaceae bacterium]|nr:hypothetical protein [Defluviitaleaceae bacterium]